MACAAGLSSLCLSVRTSQDPLMPWVCLVMTGKRNPPAFPGIGDSVGVPSHLLMTGSSAVSTFASAQSL